MTMRMIAMMLASMSQQYMCLEANKFLPPPKDPHGSSLLMYASKRDIFLCPVIYIPNKEIFNI